MVDPFKDIAAIPEVAVILIMMFVKDFVRLIKNDFPVPGDPWRNIKSCSLLICFISFFNKNSPAVF